jgi:hypothetical protein
MKRSLRLSLYALCPLLFALCCVFSPGTAISAASSASPFALRPLPPLPSATPIASSFSTAIPANRLSAITLLGSDADGTALVYAIVANPSMVRVPNVDTGDFALGRYSRGLYMDGWEDEVGCWEHVLTPAERTQLYNAGAGLPYAFTGAASTQGEVSVLNFHASGSDLSTTGSVSSSSVTLTVADAKDFKAGQYVLVARAGASGADLIAQISTISGNTFTLASAASTTVSGVLVQHDDTIPFRRAIAAVGQNGSLFVPKGKYLWNAPLDSACNALVCLPANPSGAIYTLKIVGEVVTRTHQIGVLDTGTMIKTTRVTGSGSWPAMLASGTYSATVSNVSPEITNLNFRTSANPTLSILNFHNAADAIVRDVTIDQGVAFLSIVAPTTRTAGVIMPATNNYTISQLENVYVLGQWEGFRVAEHTRFLNALAAATKVGFYIEGGFHLISGTPQADHCATVIEFGGTATVDLSLNVERYETPGQWYSSSAGNDLIVTAGVAHGVVRYKVTTSNVGDTTRDLTTTGVTCALSLHNDYTNKTTADCR